MPGFLITNLSSSIDITNYDNKRCKYDETSYGKWKIFRNSLKKFIDDKIINQNEDYIVVTEGVMLNKCQLLKKYNCSDLFELVILLKDTYGTKLCNEFRGSFSGAVYDKAQKEWIVYTNHYGDNSVFYYNHNGVTIIASEINYIINLLASNGIKYSLNEKAIYYHLTYGFMGDNSTFVSEIKRLAPGSTIHLTDNGLFDIKEYYRLYMNKYDLSSWTNEQLIDRIDELFRDAIQLEYDKDIEYGYEHLADLSGGLDSRMNVWVAHEMGYHNMTNITYCQSGSTDEKVAKQISRALKTNLVFYPLDSAECMMDIDTNVTISSGSVVYCSITGGKKVLEELDPYKFGIEHTGQLGDVILGSFLSSPEQYSKNTLGGMYSYTLSDEIKDKPLEMYQNYEQYMLYVRGLRGALSSHFIRRNFVEVASPFLHIEFMEFCFSIPLEKRIDHKIYIDWVKKKYPMAADFIWEKRGVSITAPKWYELLHRAIHNGPNKILRAFKLEKPHPNGMNPMDYWYSTNSVLKEYLDNYFKENISNKLIPEKLKDQMTYMYNNDRVLAKAQVLTVLSIIKQYFDCK